MEPTTTPFFVLPQNKSRVSLMGESSSSGSSSGRDSQTQTGKGRSRGSLGSRVSVGLGNLGFGVRSGTSVGVGSPSLSPSLSPRVLEDELGEGTEAQFPVGTPPDSRVVAALDAGSVVSPPLDARGVVSLDSRGVVPPDSRGAIPPDPRDHTVLDTIYNEMHSERFINLSPLSLLANTVGLWFKGESFSFIPSVSGGTDDDGVESRGVPHSKSGRPIYQAYPKLPTYPLFLRQSCCVSHR